MVNSFILVQVVRGEDFLFAKTPEFTGVAGHDRNDRFTDAPKPSVFFARVEKIFKKFDTGPGLRRYALSEPHEIKMVSYGNIGYYDLRYL